MLLKKTLLATILDAYQEYCNFGYPKDPKIYVIRANKDTLQNVSKQLNNIITKKKIEDNWGFRLEEDLNLSAGHIIFGPEQITIKWDGI